MSTSKIRVDSIQSSDPTDSAVTLSRGATVPSGQSVTGSGMVVNGTITATSFSGDGSGLTGVQFATVSKTIAFSFLAG